MSIPALFIGIIMSVMTILMVRERVMMKRYSQPETSAETLYEASMGFGLVGAVFSGVWLYFAFFPIALNAVWIIGLLLLAALTILIGICMGLICNAGHTLRAEEAEKIASAKARAAYQQGRGQ